MVDLNRGVKLIVETCMEVKPGETILIIADNYARPMRIAEAVMEAVLAIGAEALIIVKTQGRTHGTEPPKPVAAAMKAADSALYISDKFGIGQTSARQEATAVGLRWFNMMGMSEDDLARDISAADIMLVRDNTEKLAERLTQAKSAKVTSAAGTSLTMSLEGRQGLAVHPMSGNLIALVPDYGEATIAPVEGTAEGVIIVDAEIIGWGFVLTEPLRLSVRAGRVVDISGPAEDAERLRQLAAADENANNIAEFAMGTSHLVSNLRGTRRDAGIAGTVHIAIGRNDTIGGVTQSSIHVDGLLTRVSVELDGKQVLRDGVFQV